MTKNLIIIATLIASSSFNITCSEKKELEKSLENLRKATENCTNTIKETIATAEKATLNIQKTIENLENNRTRYCGSPYTTNEALQK